MDGINGISQKSELNPITGSNDDFRSVADGFAALLQLSGNKNALDGAANAAETELMRLDDNRDLVRDSHTLNDADARNDDLEDDANVEEPDSDENSRQADSDGDESESDSETAEASDGEDSEATDASGEGEESNANSGETSGQPQVAGEGAGADLGVIQGAAASVAATQVKATVETTATQTTVAQTSQVVAAAADKAGQAGVQTQQTTQNGPQQVAAVQNAQANQSSTPAQAQAAQTTTTAAQAQSAATQQTTTQANQSQAQQGQQVTQERAQAQSTEVRSAGAQVQSQDLSKRLGDNANARVQVNVAGQQAAQGATEPGQFNRFVGYNGGDSRTVSTANGQAGTGTATNAAITNSDTPAERPATQNTAPIPSSASQPHTQASQPGAPSAARADLAGMPTRADSGPTQTSQSSAASTSAPQPTVQAGATQSGQSFAQSVQQTTSAERPPAPTSSQVIDQIKVNISKSVKAGLDRVNIQLRPENLGRIEVKMELSQDGKVRALVTAEHKDTLDLLQRDSRGLEKALQDAGLRTDSNNLHFELKSEQNGKEGWAKKGENANAANDNGDEELNELDAEEQEYERATAAAARGGVDQMV